MPLKVIHILILKTHDHVTLYDKGTLQMWQR